MQVIPFSRWVVGTRFLSHPSPLGMLQGTNVFFAIGHSLNTEGL